jgi:hypothetical protein
MEMPVFYGSAAERRLQGMAWAHGRLRGVCRRCKKVSDLLEYAEKDSEFKHWRRSTSGSPHSTQVDVHHPDWKRTGPPQFRLGNMYVFSAGTREEKDMGKIKQQQEKLLENFELLKGCELLCIECHVAHHKEHGGKAIHRAV